MDFIGKKPKHVKGKLKTMHGVSGKVAQFSKKLFDKYDIEARETLKNVLGDAIRDNEDKYGEDMIFNIKPFPYKYLEVQVYSKWDASDFPYTFPFVYARKMRFSKKTLFVTFNKFFTEMVIFGREAISNTPSKLKKYDRENVHFVSWGKVMRFTTDKLTPKLIKTYAGEFSDTETESINDVNSENSVKS